MTYLVHMKYFLILIAAFFLLVPRAQAATADFAMGCFWCAEHDFEKLEGVSDVVSGYEGGTKETATYEQVSSGTTGHFETVRVKYDPEKIKYEELLTVFWDNVDPFDAAGQFCDKGKQYSAVIFTANEKERHAAQASLEALQSRHKDKKVAVQVLKASEFYPAETYHQNYAENNKIRYNMYRSGCGRDQRLNELKGD